MDRICIGKELRSLNNLVHRFFEFSGHKKEIETVTGTNGWIIGYLAENAGKDIFQKDLENQFTITRSTASKVLNLMEQKGLVKRLSVARDARLRKIVLTDKAWEISAMMQDDVRRMEQTLTKGFSDVEIQTLHVFLQRMKANLSNS